MHKLSYRKVIKEKFSNFEYNLPEDPEKILYDFYFLTTYSDQLDSNKIEADYAIKEAKEKIVNELQKHMLLSLRYACASEMRYLIRKEGSFVRKTIYSLRDEKEKILGYKYREILDKFLKPYENAMDLIENDFEGNEDYIGAFTSDEESKFIKEVGQHNERSNSFISLKIIQRLQKLSDIELMKLVKAVFSIKRWETNYGGSSWAEIADAYIKLKQAKTIKEKIIWIDHAYDLQHNTDTIFNKLKLYYKGGFEWIRNALDWKFEVSDIRDFYYKVSKQLKPIVAYVSKNIQNKAIHDPDVMIYKRWEDGTWEDGVWKNGTWEDGVWKNGRWENGIWYHGTWENGTWEDGRREDGTWEDGTWIDGIWKNGVWKNGRWENGTWEDGTWKNGTWIDGVWKNGVWKNGIWKNGRWEHGRREDGTWENGTWKNGVWKNGVWKNGTWEIGIWKNGRWEDGRWKDGTWMDGTWEDGIWYNGRWEKGVWERGIWRKGVWKNGRWEDGTWYDGRWERGIWMDGTWENGTWEDGVWKNGNIYSNKFKVYIESKINPKKFYELEKKSESLEELKKLLQLNENKNSKRKIIEGIAWQNKSYYYIFDRHNYLPLGGKLFKKIFKPKRIDAFHLTDSNGLIQLEKIQGSKKSISALSNIDHKFLNIGINTEGGILTHIEGNMLIGANEDLFSMPDENGRRWVEIKYLHKNASTPEYKYILNMIDDKLTKWKEENLPDFNNNPQYNYATSKKHKWIKQIDNKNLYIRNYINYIYYLFSLNEVVEAFENSLRLHPKQLKGNLYGGWNEYVINDIKIKLVAFIGDDTYNKFINKYPQFLYEKNIVWKVFDKNDEKYIVEWMKSIINEQRVKRNIKTFKESMGDMEEHDWNDIIKKYNLEYSFDRMFNYNHIDFTNGNKLFMSSYPDSEKDFKKFLNENNIKTIVNSTEYEYPVQWDMNDYDIINYPIGDYDVPKNMNSFNSLVDEMIKKIKNENILIHCMGGKGRTGLIVMGILIKLRPDLSVKSLLKYVRSKRKGLVESNIQYKFLLEYKGRYT